MKSSHRCCSVESLLIVIILTLVQTKISAGRKCQEKCKEYGKLVYANETAPVLRIGAGTNKVSKCGIVDTPLIVGGTKAKPLEFPHMAVVGYGSPVFWQCGGSVISENYILTASHCLESKDKGPATKVRAGLINLKNPDESMQERNVAERIKHPKYTMPLRYHDIALLKLDKPLKLGPQVRPACLEVQENPPEKSAIASGFGRTAYAAVRGSEDLMKVTLNYVSLEHCKKLYGKALTGKQMPQGLIANMMCAGVLEGGKDTCQGDSGGPLQRVLKDPYCTYSVVGVTSFGKFCAFKNSPAIYSRVSSYLDWIESIVWP